MLKPSRSFGNPKEQDSGLDFLYKQIEYYTKLLRTLKQDEIDIYKSKAVEDNYHSNAIEGSRVTFKETQDILAGLGDTISRYHPSEKKEITDYAKAQEFMLYQYSLKTPVSELLILDIHYILLQESKPHFAGHMRVYGEEVTAGGIDVGYTLGESVSYEIKELLDWSKKVQQKPMSIIETFKFAIEFKYRLLRIHPFNDGNGRLSRLMMNYILISNHMFPLVVQVKDRTDYMDAVVKTQNEDSLQYYFDALAKIYIRELKGYVQNRQPCV